MQREIFDLEFNSTNDFILNSTFEFWRERGDMSGIPNEVIEHYLGIGIFKIYFNFFSFLFILQKFCCLFQILIGHKLIDKFGLISDPFRLICQPFQHVLTIHGAAFSEHHLAILSPALEITNHVSRIFRLSNMLERSHMPIVLE